MKPINNLGALLGSFNVEQKSHAPSLPRPDRTPAPEKNKVVSIPVRVAINRQAALIISPVRCWLSQPLPDKLPTVEHKEIGRLKAELKAERNAAAAVRDDLGNTRLKVREAHRLIERIQLELGRLKAQVSERDSIIRQLEDLRL